MALCNRKPIFLQVPIQTTDWIKLLSKLGIVFPFTHQSVQVIGFLISLSFTHFFQVLTTWPFHEAFPDFQVKYVIRHYSQFCSPFLCTCQTALPCSYLHNSIISPSEMQSLCVWESHVLCKNMQYIYWMKAMTEDRMF